MSVLAEVGPLRLRRGYWSTIDGDRFVCCSGIAELFDIPHGASLLWLVARDRPNRCTVIVKWEPSLWMMRVDGLLFGQTYYARCAVMAIGRPFHLEVWYE